MAKVVNQQYSEEEAQRRFIAAVKAEVAPVV
jgi:hypothetical protein